eukprot:12247922-Alexandrium_andersonii.AAC.1
MSASLVGSEMCIRDRSQTAARIIAKCRKAPPSAANRLKAPRSTANPVSYTHLTLPTICSV